MLAYHSDEALKSKYIARVRAHREADDLMRGRTGEMINGRQRGCAVWCTLDNYNHAAYETELGIPQALAQIEDRIFENLPTREEWEAWPEAFLGAIKPGADLTRVVDHFLVWLLGDEQTGTIRHCTEQGKEATRGVLALYGRRLKGDNPTRAEWNEARAYAAAAAADADAYAAAYAAADAYAYAAAAAADAAADADAAAYAAADARASRWRSMRDKLLELLRAAPVKEV